MPQGWLERRFVSALEGAGVTVNGHEPWALRMRDRRLLRHVALAGAVGLGDAYVDGWWECDAIDQLFDRCLRADLQERLWWTPPALWSAVGDHLFNHQRHARASRHVRAHYDIGNDLFEAMLDRCMVYSCAYWKNASTLDDAQENKLDLVCRKLGLARGMTLLDIGCGWGGLARFAAERYACRVVGITLSPAQAAVATERCKGLPVEIRLQDYRDVAEVFDRVVSVGMFEHVGQKNHGAYMRAARRNLAEGGLFLLHTFASRRSWPDPRDSEVLWIRKHIFPGMVTPSLAQVGRAIEGKFVLEDVHNIGADYDPTLMAWHANFVRAWPGLQAHYGERFFRLWKYYLLSAAGAFRSRKYSVWQLLLSPQGVRGGYERPETVSLVDARRQSVLEEVKGAARERVGGGPVGAVSGES